MTNSTPISFADRLDQLNPARTAGSLPAARTMVQVESALASDNIDAVKAELEHTRAHYNSLEYALFSARAAKQTLLDGIESGLYPTPSSTAEAIELTLRIVAEDTIEAAYDIAHMAGDAANRAGVPVEDAIRAGFSNLDFSDPDREVTDTDISAFFAALQDFGNDGNDGDNN